MKRYLSLIICLLIALQAQIAFSQNTNSVDPVDFIEKAYLNMRKGRYNEAIEDYTKFLNLRGLTVKERAVAYLLRGEAKRELGKFDEAIFDFTRALNQWPHYPQALYDRGEIYKHLGRLEEAYYDIYRAADLDPDRTTYQNSLFILKREMEEKNMVIPEIQPDTYKILNDKAVSEATSQAQDKKPHK